MRTITMKSLSKTAQAVFEILVSGLESGSFRKLDNAAGTFMPLCVERLTEDTYSLAHYFEQNGDLVADPDMEFWRGADGKIYPTQFQNSLTFVRSVNFRDGAVYSIKVYAQQDQARFANLWMANIKLQQRLELRKAVAA